MNKNLKLYLKLFTSTFYLSAFTFGGGYVIVPLMKKKFVDNLKWIEENEMLDLIAISQSAPGPIAVNASILLGYRIAGFTGGLISVLGTVLPPLIILSVISLFYTAFRDNEVVNAALKGMQAGVTAVIVDVVISMASNVFKEKKILSVIIMIGSFMATYFLKINVIYIIFICGIIGVLTVYYRNKGKQEEKNP